MKKSNKQVEEEMIQRSNDHSYLPPHSIITGKKIKNAEILDLTQDFETVKRSFS